MCTVMSTRAFIAVAKDDGYRAIMVWYDGYPDNVGRRLVACYNSEEEAEELIRG